MAETKTTGTTTAQPTTSTEANEVMNKAKGFWDKYSKPIIYIGGAIILLIGGFYAYQNFIKLPKENKASNSLYAAEGIFDKMSTTGFSKDSVNLVLNGGTTTEGKKITGLLKVISQYGGTKAGNLAKYMAGASYLQIKEFDKAIKYLKDFDANGATQIQMRTYVMLGHAYSEQKKTAEALDNYKKATTVNEKDEAFTADALNLAASYAQAINNNKEAIELYKKLKAKYPTSAPVSSGDVDKQLASLGDVSDN